MKPALLLAFYLGVALYLIIEDLKDPSNQEEGRAYFLKLAVFMAWPLMWVWAVWFILASTFRNFRHRNKVKP